MEESSSDDFGFVFNDKDLSDRILHIETPGKDGTFMIRSLHISSAILAANSGFFYKLFKKTGRKQRDVTLKINQSEKAAFMELLQFMYTKTLSATSCSVLVDVLMAAEKFEIKSCVKHCIQLLLEMPMSLDSAILYLDLPSNHSVIKPLIDASKAYLVARFRYFYKSQIEAVSLPLRAIEILLGSKDIHVDSEYEVYNFILDWGEKHYPKNPIVRGEIVTKLLSKFVDFPSMSCPDLRGVLFYHNEDKDFDRKKASSLIGKALFFKAQFPFGKQSNTVRRRFHRERPVKAVHVDFRSPRCVIYFDLRKTECLEKQSIVFSETFDLDGVHFFLQAGCYEGEFRLGLGKRGSKNWCEVNVDFAVMKNGCEEFERQYNVKNWLLAEEEEAFVWFETPWNTFVCHNSEYFVHEMVHFRIDLTLLNKKNIENLNV